MLSTILASFAFAFGLAAFVFSLGSLSITRKKTVRSISLRRMAKLEAQMLDLTDSHAHLLKTIKTLRSRIGMRNLRAKQDVEYDSMPDSREDPEGWKRAMRQKLSQVNKE